MRGPFLRVRKVRIVVAGGLIWGHPIYGNCHIHIVVTNLESSAVNP